MRILTFVSLLLFLLFGCKSNNSIKILILSGSNNHEWQETTPFLEDLFMAGGIFKTDVTNQPDTLNYDIIKNYDVIVNNWNSWPENDIRWNSELESGILNFVNKGGGLVFFHASTSVFYKWPEFREITIASWEEKTGHGKNDTVKVFIENKTHPVTKGISDFKIFDELWINARENENFNVLGSATDKTQKAAGNKNQPAIFVKEEGDGRIFHTILGHDVEAMESEGFKQLILRGTEWAATGKVTMKLSNELKVE